MYGDCQAISSLEGDPATSGYVCSVSPTTSNFMASMPFPLLEDGPVTLKEEIESGSGSGGPVEGLSADEQDNEESRKRKRHHRHTAHQIQEMEALFKRCPHPDDKQRLKLSQELGLKPRQVKFWFQNRRTQLKAQKDRADNAFLKAENQNLRNENYRLQAAVRNFVCPNCAAGGNLLTDFSFEEQQLRLENSRLREELEKLSRCVTQPMPVLESTPSEHSLLLLPPPDLDMGIPSRNFMDQRKPCREVLPVVSSSGSFLEHHKQLALELALAAADELKAMCGSTEPLWMNGGDSEILNVDEYYSMFNSAMKPQLDLKTEATRDSAVVITNSITLVDAFVDSSKWMEMFPTIVSKARTVQFIIPGIGGSSDGSLQLMDAEIQILTPLTPARQTTFLRYCQHNMEEGTWSVVDLPVESLYVSFDPSSTKYRRRVSGCIIQDRPNGYSMVTWLEHAEVEDKPVHPVLNDFVNSSMAFGAQRWVAVLQRQCERLASLMARNISDLGAIPSPGARKNVMRLSQRMIRSFCNSIGSSGCHSWLSLSNSSDDTVRIAARRTTDAAQPHGLILTAVYTAWLPFSVEQVFELLKNGHRRSQLELLYSGNLLHEVAHIANGSHPGNCISLFRIEATGNSSQNVELMLQESCTDAAGSLVVYATLDVDDIQVVMSGGDSSRISLLPTGFSVVPATNAWESCSISNDDVGTCSPACLLTAGLQVLTSAAPSGKLNVSSLNAIGSHVRSTVNQINAVLARGIDCELASNAAVTDKLLNSFSPPDVSDFRRCLSQLL